MTDPAQHTPRKSACKYLPLRRAIERFGARQDSILHDTVVYSIIAAERSTVSAHLVHELARGGSGAASLCE